MRQLSSSQVTILLAVLAGAGVASCVPGSQTPGGPGSGRLDYLQPPIIERALDRTFPTNGGLIARLGSHGAPVAEGEGMDPAVMESRRFYETLGGSSTARVMVPMTLADWKQTYNFPARRSDELLEDYRERAGIVIYYNKNELGLGRELGCSEFEDGVDSVGKPLIGVACYVTNYGLSFRDVRRSLKLAAEGTHPKNTVCITYRPSMETGYEIQFQVYGPQGYRQDWAQLDTMGPRANPHVCMNCHGGVYDDQRHLAKYARFLPMDPNVVVFAQAADASPGEPSVTAGLTRAGQEERIRRANFLSMATPLTPSQREMLQELYGGHPERPGTPSQAVWYPAAWRGQRQHEDMFDQVFKPYCLTCHMAMQKGMDGSDLYTYGLFNTPSIIQRFPLHAVVCGKFGMPNAQTTSLNFWDPGFGPVRIGDRVYPAAADALLDAYGYDRSRCENLDRLSQCDLAPDPDAACGNAFSGTACVRSTGRCVPEGGLAAPTDFQLPNGLCRTDGSRNCASPLECKPGSSGIIGLESFDGVCMFNPGPLAH
jgi:hypothetical protein